MQREVERVTTEFREPMCETFKVDVVDEPQTRRDQPLDVERCRPVAQARRIRIDVLGYIGTDRRDLAPVGPRQYRGVPSPWKGHGHLSRHVPLSRRACAKQDDVARLRAHAVLHLEALEVVRDHTAPSSTQVEQDTPARYSVKRNCDRTVLGPNAVDTSVADAPLYI